MGGALAVRSMRGGNAGRAVRVAVDALADRPERTFSYQLPAELGDPLPGSLVLVPYGRRLALGYLVTGDAEAGDGTLREVEAVVSGPMLTGDLLALAEEIAVYYRAPIGTTIAAMLPPGLESRLQRRWLVRESAGDDLPAEVAALAADGVVSDATLRRLASGRGGEAWIERLRRDGVLRAEWSLKPPDVSARRVRVLRPSRTSGDLPRRAPLQRAMLEALHGEERSLPDLAADLGVEVASLLPPARRLAALGLAALEWRDVERDPLAHRAPARSDHQLVAEQEDAVDRIASLAPGGELLLEGVAAAGKTDVYLAAVTAAVEAGQGAIVLVPEVSGVPQLADRVGAVVGGRLAALGLAALEWRDVERDPLEHRAPARSDHQLVAEQEDAVDRIAALAPGGELLLEGVAAAGKTDVYLAAVTAAVEAGQGAIVLVPEVSGVPQLADRVAAVVGGRLAVLHSGLSPGERHDQWWRIVRGEAQAVVGTRSAVFAPLPRLGLIVVDEAHDGGYKSDRTPRYDARWAARRRAALTGARLVLGTATPDVVTIARVRGGHTERARLVHRRVGHEPRVEVVDLRAELAANNRSIFSNALTEALDALRPGSEQAILLMNRRGAASFVLCRDCGESLRCPDCDLPFVYHSEGELLRCHHCGKTAEAPERCPRCVSPRIRYFGAGTQRVEAELRSRHPRLRVARLDSDALARRRGFEAVYDDFREGRIDVLVGTQLAAKGLDLPAVTLVGVIAADVTLNLPDYLAAERTFQLLAQVAGRAGRGPQPGRVIIQTYAPSHYAVRAAARMDVDGFADEELPRRRLLGYPPYSVLARLVVADPDRSRAERRAAEVAAAVGVEGVEVLGPLPAYVPRRAGRWRMQVVIRSASHEQRLAALERVPSGVAIDVDPESLL